MTSNHTTSVLAFYHPRTHLPQLPFTSNPILLYTLQDLLSYSEERIDLTMTRSAVAAAVGIFAEPIRENDPASSRVPSLPARATDDSEIGKDGRDVLSR